MRDIPLFTGQNGTATLIFREIPYRGLAYVLVRQVWDGRMAALLAECRDFCRAAGATRVLATADEPLDFLPHVHDMVELSCRREALPPPTPPVPLCPVTEETFETYRTLYNRLFRAVPNAATCTVEGLRQALREEQVCLALDGGEAAGVAQWTDGCLRAIGVLPAHRGLGYPLALTILARMTAETVTLGVSSANGPALRLYERLGFVQSRLLSRWYDLDALREG